MARQSKQVVQRVADDTYLGLVRALPLRPIRSEAELDRAIAMIDSLITRNDLKLGEEDYVDVLSDLVHKYEAEHDPDCAGFRRGYGSVSYRIELHGANRAGHGSDIAESTISEIVGGNGS